MKNIKDSKIIVCSIVRNAARGLKRNIPIIETICASFKDYKIFVYENDSTDNTKELLIKWKNTFPSKIEIITENIDPTSTVPHNVKSVNPFYSKARISKMVSCRNQYMEMIEKKKWDADYLMVVDLDVAQLYIQAILTSFSSNIEWDAVTAFGYSLSPKLKRRYHDTYALTEYKDENTAQTETKIKYLAEKYGNLTEKDDWIRVFSAFGGLAIYKYDAVKGLKYQLLSNDDDRVEVKCEHYSIYKQMAEAGYNKVYINPAMCLKYQSLSYSIIKNHILRKLRLK